MIFLGDDDHLSGLENIPCAVKTVICGETGVIHEHIFGGNPLVKGDILHRLHFIILFSSVIAAHQKLRRGIVLVKLDSGVQTILQHRRWRAVSTDSGAKDQNTICVGNGRNILW